MNSQPRKVGAKIAALRRRHGWTQTEAARRCTLSVSYFNQLENDSRQLSDNALILVADGFGVDPGYFDLESSTRLVAALKETLGTAGLSGVETDELRDMAQRYPTLAEGILRLARRTSSRGENTPESTPSSTKQPTLTTSPPSPVWSYELVRDYFYFRRNHFEELDFPAEKLGDELGSRRMRTTRLAALLDKDAGVTVRFAGHHTGARRTFDPTTKILSLRSDLTDAQQLFELALQWAFLKHRRLLDELVDDPRLPTTESKTLTRVGLAQYFAAATLMPYTKFLMAAEASHYDVDNLGHRFGTGFETTCQRLSSLQRPGQEGVPFTFVRTDRAGNISKRQSATAFHFSRSGSSCPLWVVHRVFDTPGRIVRQIADMPDGRSYLWIARSVTDTATTFGEEPQQFAIGLGCNLRDAHKVIYSRGLAIDTEPGKSAAVPIGADCHSCPRRACRHRAFPATGAVLDINENFSPDIPYKQAQA